MVPEGHDGKQFLNALYRKLSRLHRDGQVITATVPEYLAGNPARGVPAHPVEQLPQMSGSGRDPGSTATTIPGSASRKKTAAGSTCCRRGRIWRRPGYRGPIPKAPPPTRGTKEWYGFMAWEAMYAAEGSDWFWWYGADQAAPGGRCPVRRGVPDPSEERLRVRGKSRRTSCPPGVPSHHHRGEPRGGTGGDGAGRDGSAGGGVRAATPPPKRSPVAIYIAGEAPGSASGSRTSSGCTTTVLTATGPPATVSGPFR